MSIKKIESCSRADHDFQEIDFASKKNKKIYSFINTPAQVCPDCGERWFSSETLKIMDETIKGKVALPYHSIVAIEYSFSGN